MAVFQKGKNWYIDYYDKGRRKRKKIGHSKKLAEQVLKDVETKIVKKEYLGIIEEKKILFEAFVTQYLVYSQTNKSFSTYDRRDRYSAANLKSAFEGKYLSEITPEMVEEYKAGRLQKVEPATVNRELACLKHMYTKAAEWGYVRMNPTKSVKKLKEPPGRLRYVKPDEVNALLAQRSGHLRPLVVTAINTGMRRGELFNLKWPHVDLANRIVTVINSKNNESRAIPINHTLYEELLGLYQAAKGEYVFCSRYGRPFKEAKEGFKAALRRANIEDFRFHDLRHTFGSHMVMQGVNPRTLQQIMGHKDIKMTMRYSHLSPEYVQEAVERLDTLWTLFGHQEIKEKSERAIT